MRFLQLSNRPHPFIFNLQSTLIPALTTLIIILFFRPFGFHNLSITHLIIIGVGLSLIIAISIFSIVKIGQKLLPSWFDEDNWTIFKELVLIMTGLVIIILFIFSALLIFELSDDSLLSLFTKSVFKTILFAFFSVLIMILFEQYNYQKQKSAETQLLNQQLLQQLQIQKEEQTKKILLKQENDKIGLQIMAHNILYIQSEGNYVEVFYRDETQGIQRKLLRNRLKNILTQLPEDIFFHCHKSYIVNLKNVVSVKGNARNFELILQNITIPIPVSRSKSTVLQNLLKA